MSILVGPAKISLEFEDGTLLSGNVIVEDVAINYHADDWGVASFKINTIEWKIEQANGKRSEEAEKLVGNIVRYIRMRSTRDG